MVLCRVCSSLQSVHSNNKNTHTYIHTHTRIKHRRQIYCLTTDQQHRISKHPPTLSLLNHSLQGRLSTVDHVPPHPSPHFPSSVSFNLPFFIVFRGGFFVNPSQGSGERFKLLQQGLGQSPSCRRFWDIPCLKKTHLVLPSYFYDGANLAQGFIRYRRPGQRQLQKQTPEKKVTNKHIAYTDSTIDARLVSVISRHQQLCTVYHYGTFVSRNGTNMDHETTRVLLPGLQNGSQWMLNCMSNRGLECGK